MNNGCVYTAGAGGLDDWAGSLRGLMTDPARFTNKQKIWLHPSPAALYLLQLKIHRVKAQSAAEAPLKSHLKTITPFLLRAYTWWTYLDLLVEDLLLLLVQDMLLLGVLQKLLILLSSIFFLKLLTFLRKHREVTTPTTSLHLNWLRTSRWGLWYHTGL